MKLVWHYVDDFITVGAPRSEECARNVEVMHRVCRELNVPMEPEKDEGPATYYHHVLRPGVRLDKYGGAATQVKAKETESPDPELERKESRKEKGFTFPHRATDTCGQSC